MTKPVAMNICPSEETLAAFIDGRLDPEARQRVIEHIVECAECRDIVMTAQEFQADEADEGTTAPARKVSRFSPRATFIASAVLAAAAVLIVVFGPMVRERWENRDGGMQALVEASEELRHRPTKARLSAPFPYREYQGTLRSGGTPETETESEQWELQAIARERRKKAGPQPSVADAHALGILEILLKRADKAIPLLEGALKRETKRSSVEEAIRDSRNAALLNDLAVAYLTVMDQRNDDPRPRDLAVEAAQRAWTLKKSPEIAWTRAVALQSLGIPTTGAEAWEDYLETDPASQWRIEAEEELRKLTVPTDSELFPPAQKDLLSARSAASMRPVVARFPQDVRMWCEDELLPEWGRRARDGHVLLPELERIGLLAAALKETNGESDVAEMVSAIRVAEPRQRLRFAEGLAAYGEARKAIRKPNASIAVRQSEIAIAALADSPFSHRARLEHAAAVYLANDYPLAIREIQIVLDEAPAAGRARAGFLARAHWILGIAHLHIGLPEKAIEHYAVALDRYRGAGERDYESTVHALAARAYDIMGRNEDAARHRHEALDLLGRTGNQDHRHLILFEAAYAAIGRNARAAGSIILDAVVSHDLSSGNAVTACTSLLWRGAFRYRLGLMDRAEEDITSAERMCRQIPDAVVRERSAANLALARAMLRPETSGSTEAAALDQAIFYYKRTKSHVWLGTAYMTRARTLAARGKPAGAESDFQAALREAAQVRRGIADRSTRLAFTATADDVADAYVEFLLQQGRSRDALLVADRSRAREMVDSPGAQWSDQSEIDPLALLPSNTTVLAYRVLGRRIVCWVLRQEHLENFALKASVDDLSLLLEGVDADATAIEIRETFARLHQALIEPVMAVLGDADALIVVPDAELERVPFAGLYDQRRQRFVVEDHSITTVPSLTLFVQSAMRFEQRRGALERAVIVNASRGDELADPLPQADAEADTVASLFRSHTVLDDVEGGGETLFAVAANATNLHVAAHGVQVLGGALRALRLGHKNAGMVTPTEIFTASLPKMRLVYLSACDSDIGPIYKSEGGVTIARSFFAAGAPVVVATLWRVNDTTARQVAESFYRSYLAGAAPAEALRDAQKRLLSHSPGSRPDWAAFRVVGAGIPLPKRTN